MNILGISGNLNLVYEHSDGDKHDAAAVLVRDGTVIAAVEEERLNRIKHSDKFPVNAIRFVLEQGGITLQDLDQVCYYGLPQFIMEGETSMKLSEKIQALISEAFGCRIDESKLYFVHHHLAHAVSTFHMSGFDKSLVLSIDGQGDGISGMILTGDGKNLEVLDKFSVDDSLGIYYLNVIHVLGYRQFDEYKVMGLAPYGNPDTYRDIFKGFYELLPEGKYKINVKQVKKIYLLCPRRKKGEPFNQVHKDIAAALQESLEEIVMHMLKHYRAKYPDYTTLCLAGGVAHNCSMNGKILYSGMFEDMFIQPASHDAGCALGAALYRYYELAPDAHKEKLEHLYWGPPLGDNAHILKHLEAWQEFITFEQVDNIAANTAQLMADGEVVGWAQGNSEFGPRALGNRSIVADPRPEENKDIINAMVKKREAYRPFAPSVQEEYVEDYFYLPFETKAFPYMIFVVRVNEDKQKLLGAITHIDGTARIQTVSRDKSPQYWELIDEFRKITGAAMVLNTSFNNNAEPIVNSVHDALVCFYTTKLNVLAVGDYLVRKRDVPLTAHLQLIPSLPKHNVLTLTNKYISLNEAKAAYEIKNNFDNGYHASLSPEVFRLLNEADGKTSLAGLMEKTGIVTGESKESALTGIMDLWGQRFVIMKPEYR
jgi:carbamoyltransferase